jgi:TolB-like protein/DNA-binding winged helix-turn-helix (wHTH) protein/Tfp pilus assembly protein PilF
MASEPIKAQDRIRFGEDFELDVSVGRLQRGGRVLKLERIPLEILVLLLENRGEIVTRDEIVAKVWGKGAFLDTDNSIRGAIRKIRQVLKDDPEYPKFIQTITGQGYRFIASVIRPEEENRAVASKGHPSTVPEGMPIHHHVHDKRGPVYALISELDTWLQDRRQGLEEKEKELWADTAVDAESDHRPRETPRLRRWLVLGGVAVLALLAVAYVTFRSRRGDTAHPKIRSLAVLPLKNLSGDPAQEYFADGMTESVVGRLSTIRGLRVISRTSAMSFKDTRMSTPEIAEKLHVDAIVEGSVIREGSRVRVHAQLIRGATDEHFWSETYDRDLGDVLALESEVAQAIARKVEVTLTGEEEARLVAVRHVAPEVYESYLKGQFVKGNTRADVEQSITYFEEAIKKDPTFAPAYVGLAGAYDNLGTIFVGGPPEQTRPKVVSAARKALELDPDLAEPHGLLADIYQLRWQWSDAEVEYKRALELKPNDALAHLGFSHWLLCQGRTEEALVWAQRGRELDPLAVSGVDVGWILFQARRYPEAMHELRSVLAARPDDAGALYFLGFALIGNAQPEEAIPTLEKAVSIMNRSPGSIELLATAHARAGHRTEALRLINELKLRRQTGYLPAGAFINPYLALGDYDQAFAWFERAYQEKSIILQFLKVHPFFDPVRGDPRFADLLRRVGLG